MIRGAAVVLVASVGLAACGGPYPGSTLGQQVQSWMRTTGFSAGLDALQGDARRVPLIEARHDPAALRTDCDVLVTDALSANQNLPTPDDRLTAILTTAYAAAAAAGKDCLQAAGGRPGMLARSATELAAAASGYVKAQARIDDVGAVAPGGS